MNASDLYLLGRQLMKIGEDAMRGASASSLQTGARLIVLDAVAHPDSSISEITTRTGLPQSYVSESVARLRERGAIETRPDPSDGRRTLVRVREEIYQNAARVGAVSVDDALTDALGLSDPDEIAATLATLESLAKQLRPGRSHESSGRLACQSLLSSSASNNSSW
jgi:DNA-binding MarR family transcriptional regulator